MLIVIDPGHYLRGSILLTFRRLMCLALLVFRWIKALGTKRTDERGLLVAEDNSNT